MQGVHSLAYVEDLRLLVSCGMECDVFVWNPFVDRVIFRLRGHVNPMIGVVNVPHSPILISADRAGIFKVWDLRSIRTLETFASSKDLGGLFSFFYNHSLKRLYGTHGRRYQMFHIAFSNGLEYTDVEPICCAEYCEALSAIVTAAGRMLRLWDVRTGRLLKTYADVVPTDITCATFDDRRKKLFVGASDGTIACLNIFNGAEMKTLHKHSHEVSSLTYVPLQRVVVSAGWDHLVLVHDDLVADGDPLIRSMEGSKCTPPLL